MAPTPLAATYKVNFYHNNTATLTLHTHEMLAAAQVDLLDPSGYDLGVGAAAIPATTAIANFVTLYKALFTSQTTIQTWTLFTYVAPNWIPVYSASIGTVGTHGGTLEKAHLDTLSFRTATGYQLMKFVTIESAALGLYHESAPGGAILALVNDLTTYSAGTSGGWYVGRGNHPANRFVFETGSFSRRLRRKYNLL